MADIYKYTFGISNMYIVKDRGVITIDTGCFTEREKYYEAFSEAGIEPWDVNLLVITHGHTDHFEYIAGLKEITGAPVVCHELAAAALMAGKNPEFLPRGERGKEFLRIIDGSFPSGARPLNPDITFETEFNLAPYGVAGRIIHTPGHSDCSSTVLLDSGEAMVGDMLIVSPFTGGLGLSHLATDESKLYESYRKVISSSKIIYGGHGDKPVSKEEFLEILANDYSGEAVRIAEEFRGR